MKAFTCFVRVLSWIVMFALGALLIIGYFSPDYVKKAAGWLHVVPGSAGGLLVGIALTAIGLLWVIWRAAAVVRSEHIEFETERGKVLVTLSALQESLGRVLVEDENVRDARVLILNAGKPSLPLRVLGQVVIHDRHDVVACQKHLQALLEERFKEMMVVERDVRYDVELVRIRPKGGKGEEEAGDKGALFHGPEYPVDNG